MKNSLALKSFLVFSIIYLSIILSGLDNIAWFMKPFLIPFLLFAVITTQKFTTKNILIIALTFSWLGDIALMYTYKGDLFFILGLLLFLVSHIMYIILFLKQKMKHPIKEIIPYLITSIVIWFYLLGILYLLLPKLGPLKIPVTIYAVTIFTMVFFAIQLFYKWTDRGKYFVVTGAFAFVCSDTLLAFNKFYAPINNASFWIMITYLIAQFCITLGILGKNKI